ncbi:MAG TPA: IS1380 family transposase [Streptosporangiaceae bacterium]|jgi:hypothetical protein
MQNTVRRPRLQVSADGEGLVGHAGGALLARTAVVTGLQEGLSAGLAPWRAARAVHDPGKIVADLAVTLALGGDCLADVAAVRAQPALFGPVASGPVVSRLVSALAGDARRALRAIRAARAAAREQAWSLAGDDAPGADGGPVTVDTGATIVIAHSDKENAAGTFKHTYGFHPLAVLADHGPEGTGEPLAILLRPGSAGSSTAADHIAAMKLALAQLPAPRRSVLVRADSAGGVCEFLSWLRGRRLQYSVGMSCAAAGIEDAVRRVPARAWTPACDGDGIQRDGARVTELTGLLDLAGWPPRMRVIARKERPHPGAQLRLTDAGGCQITCFATSTRRGQLADLELRHRRRARCEDRIRCAKDTGLRSLPLHGYAQSQVWCELAALAGDLTARMQLPALTGAARRREPRKLRFRLLATAGRIVRGSRRLRLRLDARWPRAAGIAAALARLAALHPA